MVERPSARLLVVDAKGRLLLFRFVYGKGALTGRVFWATPGGGLDPGELGVQVRVILDAYQDEMRRTGASYADMFKKVKTELAKKYKAVL